MFETEPRPRQKVQDESKVEAVVLRLRQGKAKMLRGRGKDETAKKTASRLSRSKALPRGLHHCIYVTLNKYIETVNEI